MSTITLSLVRGVDGSVDVEASVEAAREQILTFIAEREEQDTKIGEVVHGIFDKYRGSVIPMPALTSLVLQQLGASPETFKVLGEKVAEYLRGNAGEQGFSTFAISRGRGGGVKRWCDVTE